MKKPILLVCDEMLSSIDEQRLFLLDYKEPTSANFLFVYTLLEGVLRELSFQLYYAFPEKLNGNNNDGDDAKFEIEKKDLLTTNDYYFVLNSIIDRKLYKISKESISKYLEFFFKLSGIKLDLDKDLLDDMTKARNIIAHSNSYKVKPWNMESLMFSDLLNKKSLTKYINYIDEIFKKMTSELEKKYKKYTYEKLLLDSWEYTCPKFFSIYEVFDFSNGNAQVKEESAIKCIRQASSGEKYLVSIWLENYNPEVMYRIMKEVGSVYPTAHNSMRNEIRYLHQLFKEFPYLVDNQKFKIKDGKING